MLTASGWRWRWRGASTYWTRSLAMSCTPLPPARAATAPLPWSPPFPQTPATSSQVVAHIMHLSPKKLNARIELKCRSVCPSSGSALCCPSLCLLAKHAATVSSWPCGPLLPLPHAVIAADVAEKKSQAARRSHGL